MCNCHNCPDRHKCPKDKTIDEAQTRLVETVKAGFAVVASMGEPVPDPDVREYVVTDGHPPEAHEPIAWHAASFHGLRGFADHSVLYRKKRP